MTIFHNYRNSTKTLPQEKACMKKKSFNEKSKEPRKSVGDVSDAPQTPKPPPRKSQTQYQKEGGAKSREYDRKKSHDTPNLNGEEDKGIVYIL